MRTRVCNTYVRIRVFLYAITTTTVSINTDNDGMGVNTPSNAVNGGNEAYDGMNYMPFPTNEPCSQ